MTWENRAHFFAIAARAMRQVLINDAQRRMAQKRGGGMAKITFDEAGVVPTDRAEALVALDDALNRLATYNERQSQIVEFRFFAGLSVEETAAVLDVSARTVKRDWRMARAWLSLELKRMM